MDNFVIGTIQENIKTLSNEIQVLNSNTPIKLSDLSDVSAVTPADGDTLVYNATYNIFEPKAQSGGSGGSSITELDDIPGVTITGVQDNQFLKYSGGNWINSSTVTDTTYIQGIGVYIIDDTISIGQKVGTTDDVTFKSLVLDDSLELGDGVANATCKFTKVSVDMIDSEFKFRNVNENLLASISSVADGEGGNLRFYTKGSDNNEVLRLTITKDGAIGLGNLENCGTSGQYLKSNGPSSAVSWEAATTTLTGSGFDVTVEQFSADQQDVPQLRVNGENYAHVFFATFAGGLVSDDRIKWNETPINTDQAIEIVKRFKFYQYDMLKDSPSSSLDPEEPYDPSKCKVAFGVIAQEIEELSKEYPELKDTAIQINNLKGVDYNHIFTLLGATTQMLISRIETLENEVKQLKDGA